MKQLLSFSLFLLLLASCGKKDLNDPWVDAPLVAETRTNISYGTDTAQRLDLFLPAGRSADSTRLLVMIHGGAWMEGDKKDFTAYMDTLKKRLPSYAIANLNYRLATIGGANVFPTQENDVAAALKFLYDKRFTYNVSDKVILLGASAGGHLALLQGFKRTTPVRAKAIIDFFGPTDMAGMYNSAVGINQLGIQLLLSGTPQSNSALYQSSSPISYANAQSCPTLILQGGADPLVPVAQAIALRSKLTNAGAVVSYAFYPTEGHGWTGANLTNSFNRIETFLKENVK